MDGLGMSLSKTRVFECSDVSKTLSFSWFVESSSDRKT